MARESQTALNDFIAQSDALEAAIQTAVREALLRHKQAGNPIAVWENGQVQWISAEKIDLSAFETPVADAELLSKPRP
jgi:hypothetical protein